MNRKYQLDTEENRKFMNTQTRELLDFGRRFPSPGGSSYYLGDDGSPWIDRNRETWITSRMVHVYSIGSLLGISGCKELATQGLQGLKGELRDNKNGGWYAGLTPEGSIIPGKQCYAHAFVILAASSAVLAGIDGAEQLLKEALGVYDRYFWDDNKGLAVDSWNTEFTVCDDYRGLNANMHTVEAFLAASDVTGNSEYRERAGRIIDYVYDWAVNNNYRIPEHYNSNWNPDLNMNKDKPDDPFKPYGATPGHGIEWARLIVQWNISYSNRYKVRSMNDYNELARNLYERAVKDAWNADGARGICYTTDWKGKPVVRDRMHWTLAEAINTSAVLFRLTGKADYKDNYAQFCQYLDECVLDKVNGSWYHQLDEENHLKTTVWPGKSDIYHALQATLIPYKSFGVSIAKAVARRG